MDPVMLTTIAGLAFAGSGLGFAVGRATAGARKPETNPADAALEELAYVKQLCGLAGVLDDVRQAGRRRHLASARGFLEDQLATLGAVKSVRDTIVVDGDGLPVAGGPATADAEVLAGWIASLTPAWPEADHVQWRAADGLVLGALRVSLRDRPLFLGYRALGEPPPGLTLARLRYAFASQVPRSGAPLEGIGSAALEGHPLFAAIARAVPCHALATVSTTTALAGVGDTRGLATFLDAFERTARWTARLGIDGRYASLWAQDERSQLAWHAVDDAPSMLLGIQVAASTPYPWQHHRGWCARVPGTMPSPAPHDIRPTG